MEIWPVDHPISQLIHPQLIHEWCLLYVFPELDQFKHPKINKVNKLGVPILFFDFLKVYLSAYVNMVHYDLWYFLSTIIACKFKLDW